MRHAIVCVLLSFVSLQCTDPKPTTPGDPGLEPSTPSVGVTAIKERGKLRLLTRNNATSYFVWHGRMMGFDYEIAELLADELGVDLDIIVPASWADIITKLESGEGDVAAAGMSITTAREQRVRFAKPYTLTHVRAVWRKGTAKITAPEDLSGRSVHVRGASGYFTRLEELNRVFIAAGRPPVDIVIEAETLETEQIIEDVAAGRVPYTLCDIHICQENKAYLPDLVIGPRVSDPLPLAWAVHKTNVELAKAIDRLFERIRANGELEELQKRYYEMTRHKGDKQPVKLSAKHQGKISAHDDWFRAAERQFGFDWRLVAAISYQESRFDPKAGSWTRGKGLFGMLPQKARELGFENINKPNPATAAAATYLSRLQSQFAGVHDQDERLRLTLAAFKCGPGHVTDARLLATEDKLDPDKWDNVAKALRKLSRAQHAAKARHGYVRGSDVVAYVNEVWDRYRAYRHVTGERE